MNWARQSLLYVAAATLVVGASVAATTPGHKAKHSAKPVAKHGAKFAPVTFVCQHGCKKQITVKAAADWKKKCPVCGCKQTMAQCRPAAKK